MRYKDLKLLSRADAIKMVLPNEYEELTSEMLPNFPMLPDVIIFGSEAWKGTNELIDFIEKYVSPKNEEDLWFFLSELALNICTDSIMSQNDRRKDLLINYQLVYKQYISLFNHPDKLRDWAESTGTYLWFEFILPERRKEQFEKIRKKQDNKEMRRVSLEIQKVYNFSDLEIKYLQYFCSQAKCDDLDASLNTLIYLWSKEKKTGKTTVASYICSFLNGEEIKNPDYHKSSLKKEMQFSRFDIPKATYSRCTLIDEGGFYSMRKSYNEFKEMITSNSADIEYKYKTGTRTKRAYRNYILSDNSDPIYFVQDESERRVLSVHFKSPKQLSFKELHDLWYNFVIECNIESSELEKIYHEYIQPNSQRGDLANVMDELKDILTVDRIGAVGKLTFFNVTDVMNMHEISTQRDLNRKIIKEVLISLYGDPDKSQRFYKSNRILRSEDASMAELENLGYSGEDGSLPF